MADQDKRTLLDYYNRLQPEVVEHDIELMKNATNSELYQLIASDCQHYISIIENYKEENLSSLFNLCIRRIEGHLLIKFRLNTCDPWIEVGFFDDESTEHDTLVELKRMINHQLKQSENGNRDRRIHLAKQLEEDSSTTVNVNKTACDQLFNDCKITSQQKKSAGYGEVPEHLRELEKQLKNPSQQTFDPTNVVLKSEVPMAPKVPKVPKIQGSQGCLSDYLKSHERLKSQLKELIVAMVELPSSQHSYVYKYVADLLSSQDPMVVTAIVLESLSNKS